MAWVKSLGHTERKRDPSLWSCPLTSTHKCYGTCGPMQTYHTYTGQALSMPEGSAESPYFWYTTRSSVPHRCRKHLIRSLHRHSQGHSEKNFNNSGEKANWQMELHEAKEFYAEKPLSAIHLTRVPHPEICNKKGKPENPKVSNQKNGQMNHTDISQKKYEWQNIHEMSNILSHHANDNQNYIETPSVRMTVIKKTKNNKSWG